MRLAFTALCSLLLTACNCNASQDVTYPVVGDPDAGAPLDNFGSWLSMDVAPDNARLTMAYYDLDRTGLGYAVGTPSADGTIRWLHEQVDGYPDSVGLDLVDVGRYASQRTAPDGTVWVAYQDVANGTLKVAQRLGPNQWELGGVVDGGGEGGNWASLQIDEQGLPVVVHCDGSDARRAAWDGTSWSTGTLYTGGCAHTALSIDGGRERVALYDTSQQSLVLIEDGSAAEVVDDAGDVGAWPSMWTDGTQLVIAYQDVENQDLKLATRQGGSWDISVVDDGPLRGADSVVFERDGALSVLYFDGWGNDLRLATQGASGWEQTVIGTEGAAVGFHNEVVFAAGLWWAGSFDHTERTLFVSAL